MAGVSSGSFEDLSDEDQRSLVKSGIVDGDGGFIQPTYKVDVEVDNKWGIPGWKDWDSAKMDWQWD